MDIIIREIEEKDYLSLLPLWNDELGVGTVTAENIAARYNIQTERGYSDV